MRALVVFESMFGNTRKIAEAIADGLAPWLDVEIVEAGAAPPAIADDIDLVVVGGPTHTFGMSRPETRRDAATRTAEPLVSAGNGIREWIAALPRTTPKVAAATFDTKVRRPLLPGSAASAAARQLRRLGLHMIARPQSFYVGGTTGPLLDGEVNHACGWGRELAMAVTALAGQREHLLTR